jgi:hypothetical protein
MGIHVLEHCLSQRLDHRGHVHDPSARVAVGLAAIALIVASLPTRKAVAIAVDYLIKVRMGHDNI